MELSCFNFFMKTHLQSSGLFPRGREIRIQVLLMIKLYSSYITSFQNTKLSKVMASYIIRDRSIFNHKCHQIISQLLLKSIPLTLRFFYINKVRPTRGINNQRHRRCGMHNCHQRKNVLKIDYISSFSDRISRYLIYF